VKKTASVLILITLFLCFMSVGVSAELSGGFTDEDVIKELNNIMTIEGYGDGDNWVGRTGFSSSEGCYGFARDVFDRLYGAYIRFSYDKGTTSSAHIYCVMSTTDADEVDELLALAHPGDIFCFAGNARRPHSMVVYNNHPDDATIDIYDNNWAGPNIVDLRTGVSYDYYINHLAQGDSSRMTIFRYTSEVPIQLEETEKLMMVGERAELKLLNPPSSFNVPTWTSSNPEVATVDEYGVVKALHYGKSTITCYAGKLTSACEIEVMDIQINRTELNSQPSTFFKTNKVQLEVIIYRSDIWPTFHGEVKWESSDPSVAKIDDSGMVTIKEEGNAVITATFKYNGVTMIKTCKVTVKK